MLNKDIDVLALGELLIDFTANGFSQQGNPVYEANPGGAPCNVLAMLQRLGKQTAFIGKVGRDAFGFQLQNALKEAGILTDGLLLDERYPTTLAFVHTAVNGDRSFSFYRSSGADVQLQTDDLLPILFDRSRIFHFGSLSLTSDPVRSATVAAVQMAESRNMLRSYDPNLRLPLWQNELVAHEQIAWGMAHCHIMKISDDEILWFTGLSDYDQAVDQLRSEYPNIELLCLSLGANGSRAYYGNLKAEMPSFLLPDTIETTGAGDTFMACILNHVLENGLMFRNENELENMLRTANAAAALITTRKGALRVMPAQSEIDHLLRTAAENRPVK